MLKEIRESNPDINLKDFISIVGECFSRLNENAIKEFLSVKIRRPVVNRLYNYYLYKNDKRKFLNNLVSNSTIHGNHIFLNTFKNNNYILNRGLINVIFELISIESHNKVLPFLIKDKKNTSIYNRIEFEMNNFIPTQFYCTEKKSKDFAICISGQYRGGSDCLPFWIDFSERYKIPIFISVWDNIGLPRSSHNNQLLRMLPSYLHKTFNNMTVYQMESIVPDIFKEAYEIKVKDEIHKLIENKPESEIYYKIRNESEFELEYAKRHKSNLKNIKKHNLNQAKMFSNIKSVLSMLKDYEEKTDYTFKNIIWTRPDNKVEKFSPEVIFKNDLITSFTDEQGCCGDFTFQFNRFYLDKFLNLCNIFEQKERNNNYLTSSDGPELIGRYAHLNGIKVKKFKDYNFKSSGLTNLKIPEEKIYSKISENHSNDELKFISLFYNELKKDNINYKKLEEIEISNKDAITEMLIKESSIRESKRPYDSKKLLEIALKYRPNGTKIIKKLDNLNKKL